MVFMVLLLAVFGAAAGNVAQAMFGWPLLVGTLALMLAVGVTTAFGSQSVERLFKWASVLLYGVYAVFLVLALSSFGGQVVERFGTVQDTQGWAMAGITYASYNVIGAVVILPVARHFLGRRDAVVAGVIAGPLAMLPALLFFVCMAAWYPTIGNEALPSDFMLRKLDMPVFHLLFQAMIFVALLESGVGVVHALNERVAVAWETRRGVAMPHAARFVLAAVLLTGSIFVADYFGLVALIANGYRALAYALLVLFVLPLFTVGAWRLWRHPATPVPATSGDRR
jgi:uncharacterized membrane protein YkvI